jgi:hypothetical protein
VRVAYATAAAALHTASSRVRDLAALLPLGFLAGGLLIASALVKVESVADLDARSPPLLWRDISWTSAGLVRERDNAGEGAGKNTNPACLAASVLRVLP